MHSVGNSPILNEGTPMVGGDKTFLLGRCRPLYEVGNNPLRVVDLFAGCGGISLGIAEACRHANRALDVRLVVEREPEPWSVYRSNFSVGISLGPTDIGTLFNGALKARLTSAERSLGEAIGSVDLIAGGPPCQGHSNLNNHTRRRDPKNQLYLRMVRAANVLQPDFLMVENVPAVAHDEERVLDTAHDRLTGLGYKVASGVVCIGDLGIPQLRKRHVLLASRRGQPSLESMKARCRRPAMSLREAIGDLVGVRSNSPIDLAPIMSAENQFRARWLLEHGEYDLPNKMRPRCHRDKPDHRYKSMYGRMNWAKPAQTITTGFSSPGQGRFLHPAEPRTLTPHEAARIQFFPDWFNFSTVAKRTSLATMIGNAVPPKLAFAAVLELLGTA